MTECKESVGGECFPVEGQSWTTKHNAPIEKEFCIDEIFLL